jgi:hypothetical protein
MSGLQGEGNAHLLGVLLTTGLAQAALSRADIPGAVARRSSKKDAFIFNAPGNPIIRQSKSVG